MCQEVGGTYHDRLRAPVFCAAVAVLWLALHKEKFPLLADNLLCAAGIAGKQRWALILPSSARVSQVTYTTVIGPPRRRFFQQPFYVLNLRNYQDRDDTVEATWKSTLEELERGWAFMDDIANLDSFLIARRFGLRQKEKIETGGLWVCTFFVIFYFITNHIIQHEKTSKVMIYPFILLIPS